MIKIVINKKKIPVIFFVKEIAFPIEYYKSTESYGTAHLTKLKCLENTLQLKYYIYILQYVFGPNAHVFRKNLYYD